MSRCFSYPPPGYTLSKEKHQQWLERIKAGEERKRKKEKKREKKEKKREKKERRKARRERRHAEREKPFEGSSLTVEKHGLAADVPSPSSFDSTANTNNKRKRTHTTSESSRCSWHGVELHYSNLLHYISLQLHDDDEDDDDWLCKGTKGAENKRQRFASDSSISSISCSGSSSAWQPRAQYLHQIDAFALPYVVPF